ncbi:NADH-quinone oxidoreductase subunit NuoE [Aquibium oceanicum]|uniref:NADH-quinone oxidoreductase subunit E n=1 Tax=Aquibium oceanicum TaxID=1670800 RepID=A0A1L3SRQ6_9HYPH|nr:NADH-quinone oxidoreductase subunit NuoE [Aquibium oceanicum]APH72084.1 NADH-quinone oxidoreductase subunit E [Aquibium oceanicum]
MSVRRLAEPAVQPAAFAFDEVKTTEAKTWIGKYPQGREQSAVIPLLMLAQEQEGWVTKAAIEHIADMLSMPYIRALEVATFYTQFQLKPVGTRAHIQVCGTTPCMLRGSEALMDVCRSKIHLEQFHPNADGTLSWEEVECLGACVNAPMVMIFKDTYEDLTPERLSEIIDEFEAGRGDSVRTGPQTERFYAAPASGFTSLKDEKNVLKATREAPSRKAGSGEGEAVPPSNAAKPKTDARVTSPALKSPSDVKVSPSVEKAESAPAPKENKAAANAAEPLVEDTRKQRSSREPSKGDAPTSEQVEGAPKSPDAGSTLSIAKTASSLSGKSAPAGDDVGEINPTVALARTAKGKRKPEEPEKPSLLDKDRPIGMERPAAPDELQMISGVGPKIEQILHSLGIFTFAQIAAWTPEERGWVDGYLRFRGRIEREDWVRQAKALADGGEAEYIRVFGKKPR